MTRSNLATRLTTILAMAATLPMLAPEPVQAGNFFGAAVGGLVGGMMLGGMMMNGGGAPRRGRAARPVAPQPGAATPSPADSSAALASLSGPSTKDQLAVLKSIYPSDVLDDVGEYEGDMALADSTSKESERDYASKVQNLIDRIQSSRAKQSATKEGDVTQHAILELLSAAIKDTHLQKFETFLGEDWSYERLRVMILDRVDNEIGSLFDGTTKGDVAMSDINDIIKKSAQEVYLRLFETSELLAANRGATLFAQRLYQVQGDQVSADMRENAENWLKQSAEAELAAIDPLIRREDNAYVLRYRAERIVYDCLSDDVPGLTSSDAGIAPTAEIARRIQEATGAKCKDWVSKQFFGPDNKIAEQDPLPLRVVWTTSGPHSDPAMYGHSSE